MNSEQPHTASKGSKLENLMVVGSEFHDCAQQLSDPRLTHENNLIVVQLDLQPACFIKRNLFGLLSVQAVGHI